MIRAFILTSSILVAGCTSIEPLRPDMEARLIPSRLDEIAFINGLREAYTPVTESIGCYDGKSLKRIRPKYSQGYAEDDPAQDALGSSQCVTFRATSTNLVDRAAQVTRYLENGFGLTDIYCQRYFVVATQTRQGRKFQRNTGSAVDVLVGSVLTALGGGTTITGLANAGFEAFDSTYKNIDDAFVVAPERDDVRKLVHAAQQDFRATVFDVKNLPQSYPGARSVIERYAGLCSFDGMRQLVADAVSGKAKDLNEKAERKDGKVEGAVVPAKDAPATTATAAAAAAAVTAATAAKRDEDVEGVPPPITPPR